MRSPAARSAAPPSPSGRMRLIVPSKTNRSRAANCIAALPGLDGRSAEARRFRDLVVALASPLGNIDDLPEETIALVRTAAGLTMQSERLQAAIVKGEQVNHDDLTRVANGLSRTLSALRARRRPKKEPSLLEKIIASHNGNAAK
ncbi:hypothetical protein [Methylosinus sp. Ce-a6]|uniref:hypothetical protein n=1 Tax=Methylosinus sp. Ce-a6 TaxID=2172005 RepID=UPI001356948A|nr:hypothetical protein [Methylosinus sp. Ce-a6]